MCAIISVRSKDIAWFGKGNGSAAVVRHKEKSCKHAMSREASWTSEHPKEQTPATQRSGEPVAHGVHGPGTQPQAEAHSSQPRRVSGQARREPMSRRAKSCKFPFSPGPSPLLLKAIPQGRSGVAPREAQPCPKKRSKATREVRFLRRRLHGCWCQETRQVRLRRERARGVSAFPRFDCFAAERSSRRRRRFRVVCPV